MKDRYERIIRCRDMVRRRTDFLPQTAVVLGSGLGAFAETITIEETLPYASIPEFPVSTVRGHQGCFVFGYCKEQPIVIMQGRVHFYEGYGMDDVVLPIRLMKLLGAERLILTNAAGGVNPSFQSGDLMLITDHIAQLVPSPLIGENMEALGTRFPDMTNIYAVSMQEKAIRSAEKLGINLKRGVYLQTTGPNYESPAEIRMFRSWGADAVGMSTACEAMAARHMGMEICGISCITNMAAGISKAELNHEEVQQTADTAAEKFQSLLTELI